MKYVRSYTTTKAYREDEQVRPIAPLFIFRNDGNCMVVINQHIRLFPGEHFGVDHTPLVIQGLTGAIRFSVEEETDFSIKFENTVVDLSRGSGLIKQVTLITTKYKTEGL